MGIFADALLLVDALVKEHGNIDAVLREFDVSPPALTTEGARSRLQTLTAEAGIDVAESADYLQPRGARQGMIGEVFTHDCGSSMKKGIQFSVTPLRKRPSQ